MRRSGWIHRKGCPTTARFGAGDGVAKTALRVVHRWCQRNGPGKVREENDQESWTDVRLLEEAVNRMAVQRLDRVIRTWPKPGPIRLRGSQRPEPASI